MSKITSVKWTTFGRLKGVYCYMIENNDFFCFSNLNLYVKSLKQPLPKITIGFVMKLVDHPMPNL